MKEYAVHSHLCQLYDGGVWGVCVLVCVRLEIVHEYVCIQCRVMSMPNFCPNIHDDVLIDFSIDVAIHSLSPRSSMPMGVYFEKSGAQEEHRGQERRIQACHQQHERL